jgi:hypothetical protein
MPLEPRLREEVPGAVAVAIAIVAFHLRRADLDLAAGRRRWIWAVAAGGARVGAEGESQRGGGVNRMDRVPNAGGWVQGSGRPARAPRRLAQFEPLGWKMDYSLHFWICSFLLHLFRSICPKTGLKVLGKVLQQDTNRAVSLKPGISCHRDRVVCHLPILQVLRFDLINEAKCPFCLTCQHMLDKVLILFSFLGSGDTLL